MFISPRRKWNCINVGFDLPHDDRYNEWVKSHRDPVSERSSFKTQLFTDPDANESTRDQEASISPSTPVSSDDADSSSVLHHSKLSEFLVIPDPPAKKTSKEPTGVCRVYFSTRQ